MNRLRIQIPHTVGLFQDKFYMSTNEYGYLKISQNFKDSHVLDLIEIIQQKKYKKPISSEYPCMVIRKEGFTPMETDNNILEWGMHKQEIGLKIQCNIIGQQYIYPFGGRASGIRFVYNNPLCSTVPNWGLNMCNKMRLDDIENIGILQRSTICSDIPYSFDLYDIKSQNNLQQYETVCQQLCEVVQRTYGIKLSQLVAEFVKDSLGQLYFIGVKAFKVDDFAKIERRLCSGSISSENEDIMEKTSNCLKCKLCNMNFQRIECSRVITNKMVQTLKSHLNKRGKYSFDCLSRFKNPQRTTRVCDVCYMIIIAEHELIKTEVKLAQMQSIPMIVEGNKNDPVLLEEIAVKNTLATKKVNGTSGGLFQWRELEMNQIKENSVSFGHNVYLQMKFYEFSTKFKIKLYSEKEQNDYQKVVDYGGSPVSLPPKRRVKESSFSACCDNVMNEQRKSLFMKNKQNISQSSSQSISESRDWSNSEQEWEDCDPITVLINRMRVHYIFTKENDLANFLDSSHLEIRLTEGTDWHNHLAIGTCDPLKLINPFQTERTQQQSFQIHFFSKKMKSFYMNAIVGLQSDTELRTVETDLYIQNGVYFPDNTYFNCDLLPIEWMELFERKDKLNKFMMEDNVNIDRGFRPFCSNFELDYRYKSPLFNKSVDKFSPKNYSRLNTFTESKLKKRNFQKVEQQPVSEYSYSIGEINKKSLSDSSRYQPVATQNRQYEQKIKMKWQDSFTEIEELSFQDDESIIENKLKDIKKAGDLSSHVKQAYLSNTQPVFERVSRQLKSAIFTKRSSCQMLLCQSDAQEEDQLHNIIKDIDPGKRNKINYIKDKKRQSSTVRTETILKGKKRSIIHNQDKIKIIAKDNPIMLVRKFKNFKKMKRAYDTKRNSVKSVQSLESENKYSTIDLHTKVQVIKDDYCCSEEKLKPPLDRRRSQSRPQSRAHNYIKANLEIKPKQILEKSRNKVEIKPSGTFFTSRQSMSQLLQQPVLKHRNL